MSNENPIGNQGENALMLSGNQKTFTQDQVNEIIKTRLGQMRKQAEKEAEAKYQEKAAELLKKEKAYMIKDELARRGMSADLANIISFDDEKDLGAKLDTLQQIYKSNGNEGTSGTDQGGNSTGPGFSVGSTPKGEAGGGVFIADPIREAMGLNRN